MSADDSQWDDAAIDRLRKLGGNDLLGKMIDLFLQGAPKRIAAARAGEQAGDWTAVGHATHALKSSAANVGARRLSQLCEQIELLANQNNGPAIPPLLPELEVTFEQVRARLIALKGASP